MNIIWNDPPGPGDCGEDGVTEFVSRCDVCGKGLGNLVYRKRGARGAIIKGHVIACSRLCGEEAAGIKPYARKTEDELVAQINH